MNPILDGILTLNEQCCIFCRELQACFIDERKFMVEFKTDSLHQNNFKKEELIRKLASARALLRQEISKVQPEILETQDWQSALREWKAAFATMRQHCQENRNFINHSVRNLEMISDNLLRLFGQLSLYNSKGSKVEMGYQRQSGKVVERAY